MRSRIQNSMILVIALTLLISYAVITLALYRQTRSIVQDEITQEADYICAAIEIQGDAYLQEMDNVRKSTLVTLLTAEGTVLYDSLDKERTDIPLAQFPELQQALREGTGEALRTDTAAGGRTFYYALQLKNGNLLWVHKSMGSALSMSMSILPLMLVLAAGLITMAWFLAKWQASRLVKPINELDLSHPLENDVYEELHPLLTSIDLQNREKDAISQMRREFSANVSHELRTPLTSISGYAEIMKEGLVPYRDMVAFSERIYEEAGQLMRMVEDTIRLSRLDEQQIIQAKETVDLHALCRAVIERLAGFAAQMQVQVTLLGSPVSCFGIPQILDDVIYNLCENAIKYNHPKGNVEICTGMKENCPYLTVEDSGLGIPEEEQDLVFERFYRIRKNHGDKIGGSGLGLSIVKHGAELHGADILLYSQPGQGTKFELIFRQDDTHGPAAE